MEKQMEITHQQLMATLQQVVHGENLEAVWTSAGLNAYGFGYMTSWFASIARKHPAVLKELLSDPRVIRAQQTLENAR